MVAIIESIGATTIRISAALWTTLGSALYILRKMFDRKMYNSAMRTVLINQIYYTSVQILPLFIGTSVLVGSLLIGIVFQILKDLGLAEFTGRILMGLGFAQ